MGRSKSKTGYCKLCGKVTKLSFEHIPPRAAFNNRPVIKCDFVKSLTLGPEELKEQKGIIEQKGAGDYTLCIKCNNDTGAWYGKNFVAWCYQGMEILDRTKGQPSLIYLHYLFPLQIIKQVLSMLISSAHHGFTDANPELREFVLNKEKRYLNPKYHIYTYFNIEGVYRNTGLMVKGSIGQPLLPMIEISYPPFGYLMTIDNPNTDERLTEISHFANYSYNQFVIQSLDLKCLPTYLLYPGDYRSMDELYQTALRNGNKGKLIVP